MNPFFSDGMWRDSCLWINISKPFKFMVKSLVENNNNNNNNNNKKQEKFMAFTSSKVIIGKLVPGTRRSVRRVQGKNMKSWRPVYDFKNIHLMTHENTYIIITWLEKSATLANLSGAKQQNLLVKSEICHGFWYIIGLGIGSSFQSVKVQDVTQRNIASKSKYLKYTIVYIYIYMNIYIYIHIHISHHLTAKHLQILCQTYLLQTHVRKEIQHLASSS